MEIGTTIYQISASGLLRYLDGTHTFQSRKVFLTEPTQNDIDEFLDACCDAEHPNDLFNLERENIKTKILKLQLSENK